MLSFEFLYGAALLEAQPALSLTLAGGTAGVEHKLHVPKDSIRHEEIPPEPALPIGGLLFTGNLKVCAIEKFENPTNQPEEQRAAAAE